MCEAFLCLFIILIRCWYANGNIRKASFLPEAPAQIIVAAVHRASAALACNKIVPRLGLDFIAANNATNGVLNYHLFSSLAVLSSAEIHNGSRR